MIDGIAQLDAELYRTASLATREPAQYALRLRGRPSKSILKASLFLRQSEAQRHKISFSKLANKRIKAPRAFHGSSAWTRNSSQTSWTAEFGIIVGADYLVFETSSAISAVSRTARFSIGQNQRSKCPFGMQFARSGAAFDVHLASAHGRIASTLPRSSSATP